MGSEQPQNSAMERIFNGTRMGGQSIEIGRRTSLVEALAQRVIAPPETLPGRDNVQGSDNQTTFVDTTDERVE